MLMHVPDWDPSRKQKPREPSPFADNDEDMPRSTYSQHYGMRLSTPRVTPVRPKLAYPWKSWQDERQTATKSTQQDAFKTPMHLMQLPSCKPDRAYEPVEWMVPLSTTSNATYTRYHNIERMASCKPKNQVPDPHRFATRPTSIESYKPFPEGLRPPTPIRQKGNDLFSTQDATSFETTFRSAFVKHQVKPYRKPARPTNAWLPPE